MSNFDTSFDRLVGNEGGYSNNPADPGGETMYGITARVARAHGYAGPMVELTRDLAKDIAKAQYWDALKCDSYPSQVAFQIFDAAYNHGPDNAIRFLQRAVGVADDGVVGPITMQAIQAMPATALGVKFLAERLAFYTKLSTWVSFGKGWTARVAQDLKYLAQDN